MRSFISTSLLLSLSLVALGCVASPGDVDLAEGALDNQQPTGEGDPCHINQGGGAGGPILDGHMDDGWCCGMSECTDPELCGADLGTFSESCGRCDYYTCLPGSGVPLEGGLGGTRADLVDIVGSVELAVELPRSTIRVETGDLGLLETLDPWADRDRLGGRDGTACLVRGNDMTNGVLEGGDCCGTTTCTDRLACGRNYRRAVPTCVPCEDGACITQSRRETSPFGR